MVLVGLLSSISIYALILTNIFCGNLKKAKFFCKLGSQVQEVYPPLPSLSFKFFFLPWVLGQTTTFWTRHSRTQPHDGEPSYDREQRGSRYSSGEWEPTLQSSDHAEAGWPLSYKLYTTNFMVLMLQVSNPIVIHCNTAQSRINIKAIKIGPPRLGEK